MDGLRRAEREDLHDDVNSTKSVTANFTATPTFIDVPPSNPFYSDIEQLFDLGITTGCNPPTNKMFCPGDFVPRQQMAAFLISAKGLTQLFPATPMFIDVPASNPFFGYIERLKEQDITTGCNPPGQRHVLPARVRPAAADGRLHHPREGADTAVPGHALVPRRACLEPVLGLHRAVARAADHERLQPGLGQPIYCPLDNVPRQQMAAFLIRAFATP